MYDIPIIFIFFNKEDSTKKVFNQIKKAKPEKLYLVSDGARAGKEGEAQKIAALRAWVENAIDWDCQVKKIYAAENMGCKGRVVSGLTEVFRQEEYAIILEDDCLPRDSFFAYCEVLLKKYKDDPSVMIVSGTNEVARKYYQMETDYTFSKNVWIWGWATWARAWALYDGEIRDWSRDTVREVLRRNLLTDYRIGLMENAIESVHNGEVDTWDYQWCYCVWKNDGLGIVPKYNLVENLGFSISEATHTTWEMPGFLREVLLDGDEFRHEITVLDTMERNTQFDKKYEQILIRENRRKNSIVRRMAGKIKRLIVK